MLEPGEYREKIAKLRQDYSMPSNPGHPGRFTVDRAAANCIEFASANLRCLLPEIPIAGHPGLINDILLNQVSAELDEDSCFLSETTEIIDPGALLATAAEKPAIFCTFHFGSYRIVNQALASRGLNYILPVASDIYVDHKRRYEDSFDAIKRYFNSDSQLTVVNAEMPTSALTMARKARAGWSMLAYIDGNTGVQGAGRRDSKTLRISLLGKPIFARKGIAFLSHFLKLPVVPVICEITGTLERRMKFHEKIDPSSFSGDREAYCQMATQKLYDVLGEYLKRVPSQWEGWLDMQKYLDMDALADVDDSDAADSESELPVEDIAGSTLVFNRQRFGFIVREDGRVLLDKDTFKLLSLPQRITDILETYTMPAKAPSMQAAEEQTDAIAQLVSMGMLSVVSP